MKFAMKFPIGSLIKCQEKIAVKDSDIAQKCRESPRFWVRSPKKEAPWLSLGNPFYKQTNLEAMKFDMESCTDSLVKNQVKKVGVNDFAHILRKATRTS